MQLRDDLIDYINNRALINKSPFRDFETNKKRLPILLAYRFGNEVERKTIRELLFKKTLNNSDKETLSSIVSNEMVVSYLNNLNTSLLNSAKNSFEKVLANDKTKKIISLILNQIDV